MLATRSLLASPRIFTMPAVVAATPMTVLAASHTFVDLVSGSIGALLPTLKYRFELTSMEAGGLVATIAASAALSQPVVGRLADHIGARRVAGVGAVLSAAMLSMIGVAPHLWIVFAMIPAGGLGSRRRRRRGCELGAIGEDPSGEDLATIPTAMIAYRALAGHHMTEPRLLIGAMRGCLSCSCVAVPRSHRCSENGACELAPAA